MKFALLTNRITKIIKINRYGEPTVSSWRSLTVSLHERHRLSKEMTSLICRYKYRNKDKTNNRIKEIFYFDSENVTFMIELKNFLSTLFKLRKKYNLLQTNIDHLAKFSVDKYSRIENGTQTLTFEDIVRIAKVYGLKAHEILNPKFSFPSIEKLPTATKKIALANKPGSVKKKNDSSEYDFNDEVLLVLSTYDLERTFTNFEIIEQLPKELSKLRKNRPIEWNKGKLKGLVVKTGNRRIGEWAVDGVVFRSKGTQEEYRLVGLIGRNGEKKGKD